MPKARNKQNLLSVLKKKAAAQMAAYPQYAGHFDKYVLCRVKRDVKTKMGTAFLAGEVAICRPASWSGPGAWTTVWSVRNQCDTGLSPYDVQILGGRGTESWRGFHRRRR